MVCVVHMRAIFLLVTAHYLTFSGWSKTDAHIDTSQTLHLHINISAYTALLPHDYNPY